jgi:glycosyltransferase 2 family protein
VLCVHVNLGGPISRRDSVRLHIGKKRLNVTIRNVKLALVALILIALAYLQFRSWHGFAWNRALSATGGLRWGCVGAAIVLTYLAYVLRAMRWKEFLQPVKPVSTASLIAPQFIGFTGLALLGRPGELVRPYLIAKKHSVSVSSQFSLWVAERVCDLGAFIVIFCADVLLFGQDFPFHRQLHDLALIAGAAVIAGCLLAAALGRYGLRALRRLFTCIRSRWSAVALDKLDGIREDLNAFASVASGAKVAALSLCMWAVISISYLLVLRAYPDIVLRRITVAETVLLIGCCMLGSLIQLPGIGGGSQLAMITVLSSSQWFNVPRELAASSSVLIWLVTFVAVVPAGLFFARRERLRFGALLGSDPFLAVGAKRVVLGERGSEETG